MSLRCVDRESLDDLRVFLERAERLGASSVRLQCFGTVLVSTVPVVTPRGLADSTPLILAVRTTELAEASTGDAVVAIRAILERIARVAPGENAQLPWPPHLLSESWAGIAPPRSGWIPEQEFPLATVQAIAESVLAPLAEVSTTQPERVLSSVLGSTAEAFDAPAGLAAAAQSLGFLTGSQPARLSRLARWTRLSTAHGHVVSRV